MIEPAADPLVDVSRETRERLEALLALVAKWTTRINLVSAASLEEGWQRHIVDSAQVYAVAPPQGSWADLGSGGGFPGLVVAILAAERSPGRRVTLVESDARKCAFLRTALREFAVPAEVIARRIEEVPPLGAAVVSARALAPLERLFVHAGRHLAPQGIAVFPKGARWRDEVATARRNWTFSAEAIPSITDADAVLLRIGGLSRASARQNPANADHRDREPEGGRGQDDDRDQPGRGAGKGRGAGAADRS